jgi:outer membrane receptor protein involved in Fe transport
MADSLTFAKGFMYARAPGFSDKLDDTNFVPRATLDWFVNDNVMLYGSIAKGIKPPSYNTTDLSDPALARVKKEELWTYEVGAKTQSEDGELTLNGALFYNDYKDQQVRIAFDGLNPGDLPRGGATNAGKTTVWGIEVDATWMPTDNLLFNASWAFTDGEYDDFVLADVQVAGTPVSISNQAKSASKDGDFSGNSTPGNPGHALSLLGKYQAQLSGDMEWFVQGTAQYQDKRWADVANLVELDSYWRASAQIGLEQENWSVSLYAENLFDDDTVEYAQEFIDFQQGFQLTTFSFPVAYYAYLPQPRTVGIKFMYRME